MFRNLGYKLEIIFRDLGLMHHEKETFKLNLLDNQDFIIPVAIFITKKIKNLLLKPFFGIRYTFKNVQLKLVKVSEYFYFTEDIMEYI